MPSAKVLQFPKRNPYLFTREINAQALGTSELHRVLFAAIRALPHVEDSRWREELKQALCDLLLEQDAAVWIHCPSHKVSRRPINSATARQNCLLPN